ncbi:DUF368 domain-containing protein [Halalkalibacillus halophilus]|uniref:DUF368 domain-containing protein n=1 Tax=Halalkalibacillus halophilus TaxID=392827 RepID=UPI0004015F74|nr:DUF368 domain-containing protein [Halalkalibacillus halophilus]
MFGLIFRGMAVGVTEMVPGISGSTVAMILGIYQRLLYSISMLTTSKKKEVLPFLLMFGFGMVIGFASTLYIIDYLLTNYRTQTLMFFVGVIVGFLPYLWKEALNQSKSTFQPKHFIIMAIFFGLVIIGQILGGANELNVINLSLADYIFLITSGFIASTALVLPGISGALILTILGLYELATSSLIALHFPIIIAIGSGITLGVLITSKLIRFLLANYSLGTYAAMIGLVSASIFAIMHEIEGAISTQIMYMSFITFVAGIVVVIGLKRSQS